MNIDPNAINETPEELYENAPCGYLSTLPDGTIIRANQTCLTWIGMERQGLVGNKCFQDLLSIGGRIFYDTHFAPLLRMQGFVNEVAFDLIGADGRALPVLANAVQKRDAGGKPVVNRITLFNAADRRQYERELLLSRQKAEQAVENLKRLNETLEERVHQEVAERLKAEAAMRQSQKMEAVGQLTGGVAHDFNNLLTVIKSSTDLLKRPNLSEERRARYVAAISDTVDRAAKLTSQLLAFARRQALKPETFDAGQSVRMLSDMVGTLTGARIQIITYLPDEPCFISADPSQFDTALINIVVNARDAMDGEGQITITVWPAETMPAIRRHAAVKAPYVAISIADTGSGIPADRIDQIFEPFFTTKGVGQGTGLGLSQVFGFVKQSGGQVIVESEVGQGTTFTLYLPRVTAALGVPAPEEENTEDGSGTCVLVVEDNRDVGTFVTQTLAELGYHTTWVENAQAALDELAKSPSAHDIVFSDVVMPGMNGVELARHVQRLYPDLPLVLTSGYSHVLAEGGHGFELLQKPYSVEALSRVLRKASSKLRKRT
ncbi:ATP-binding protein [Microvirga sp. TS319]|uniref:PAS domain-containing hybrid sensor histidine kinase/response regulator n=1 Tax=Microvirga sp. TS319 TaxID=3241165 RepID=UPI00351A9459